MAVVKMKREMRKKIDLEAKIAPYPMPVVLIGLT